MKFEPGLTPWSCSNVLEYFWTIKSEMDDPGIHYPGYAIGYDFVKFISSNFITEHRMLSFSLKALIIWRSSPGVSIAMSTMDRGPPPR